MSPGLSESARRAGSENIYVFCANETDLDLHLMLGRIRRLIVSERIPTVGPCNKVEAADSALCVRSEPASIVR